MGKGGKGNNKAKEVVQSESEQQEQEVQEDEEEDLSDFDEESHFDQDEELLKKIQDQIIAANEPLKLSWAAIHNLKTQEQKLMQQMDKQMQQIQSKYDKLKEPISHQIAKVVSGHPVQKKLYTEHELTKQISPNKHKPNGIPQFWLQVFEKSGLIDNEIDFNIMRACTNLHCTRKLVQTDDKDQEIVSVEFTFGENPYFNNKTLKLQSKRNGDECENLHIDKLDLKGEKDSDSFFLNLFDQENSSAPLFQSVKDIERSYNNSLFFFFHEGQDDLALAGEAGLQGLDEDDEDDDEDDEEDEDNEVQPVKKKKMNAEGMQKPECKPQ